MNKSFTLAIYLLALLFSAQVQGQEGVFGYLQDSFAPGQVPNCQVEFKVLPFITEEGVSPRYKSQSADEEVFDIHLPAGEALIFRYDPADASLTQFEFEAYSELTAVSRQAINKAPLWVQNDMRNNLAQMNTEAQDKWAGWMLRIDDHLKDEAAFTIAHLSKEYMESNKGYTELIDKNLEYIYKYDSLLKYVEIIETGTAEAGGNYYSTTRYTMRDTAGQVYSYDIPYEIYYWYVVHPQINTEVPGFIDPTLSPSANSYEDVKSPSASGAYFWREFVFDHGNSSIPNKKWYSSYPAQNIGIDTDTMELLVLHFLDSLKQQKYLWDGMGMNTLRMSYGRDTSDDNVMAQLNRLGASCIKYPAQDNRPTQPVRIMFWGSGNCGEHDMLNGAFGRAALLPTCGVMKLSRDHTWNGIYTNRGTKDSIDLDWVEWDSGLGGWFDPWQLGTGNHDRDGKHGVASVFMRRSDGVFLDQTKNYSDGYAKVSLYLEDMNGKPVDGAYVVLYAKGGPSGTSEDFFADNARNTASDGSAHFIIGENAVVNFGVYLNKGQYAAMGTVNNLDSLEDGKTYVHTVTVDSAIYLKDTLEASLANEKSTTADAAGQLSFNIATDGEIVFGVTEFNDFTDLYKEYVQVREYRDMESHFSFMVLDQENMLKYVSGEAFTALDHQPDVSSLNEAYTPAAEGYTYYVVHNNCRANYLVLKGSVENGGQALAVSPDSQTGMDAGMLTSIDDAQALHFSAKLYPNPSRGLVSVFADWPMTEILVYDLTGRVVFAEQVAGNEAQVDLGALPAGVYYMKANGMDGQIATSKLMLAD